MSLSMDATTSSKKSTGVFVLDIHNTPYELSEYNLFVQKQCKILKKKNIHFEGKGSTLKYIAELWEKKKEKEVRRTTAKEKNSTPSAIRKSLLEDMLRTMGKEAHIYGETLLKKEERYRKAVVEFRYVCDINISISPQPRVLGVQV